MEDNEKTPPHQSILRGSQRTLVERLNRFSNWHTSCNGGNVSDEAQMCMDAALEIERLERALRSQPELLPIGYISEHAAKRLSRGAGFSLMVSKNIIGHFIVPISFTPSSSTREEGSTNS